MLENCVPVLAVTIQLDNLLVNHKTLPPHKWERPFA